ncbi:MAG: hypothetical protein MI746_06945 [Pseudomonadales bacterium]|nr:hypothetical protein [Pseudomonadales bacterium]
MTKFRILGVVAGFISWWGGIFVVGGSIALFIPELLEAGRLAQEENDFSQFTSAMLGPMLAGYLFINPFSAWLTVKISNYRSDVWIVMVPLFLYAIHAHWYRLWGILPDWYNIGVVILIPPLMILGGRISDIQSRAAGISASN